MQAKQSIASRQCMHGALLSRFHADFAHQTCTACPSPSCHCCCCPPPALQEDDVIGLLPGGDDIAALQPLQDRVLIEVIEAAAKTTGGLLLTEGSKDKLTMGKVVAVGPGRAQEEGEEAKQVAPKVEVGSTVLYQKYSGTEVGGGVLGVGVGGVGAGGGRAGEIVEVGKVHPVGGSGGQGVGAERVCRSVHGCMHAQHWPPLAAGTFAMCVLNAAACSPASPCACCPQFEGANDKQYIVVRDSEIMAALA